MLHPRARTMLILSVPAILIGIASSLILIGAMKVAALLQRILWSNLPVQFGVSAENPLWIIAILTATGIAWAWSSVTARGMPGRTRRPSR